MTRKALLVVPINNTTMEPEINAWRPGEPPVMVAKVPRPPRTLLEEDLPAYGDSTIRSVEPFVANEPSITLYGCTAAGFIGGPRRNAEMVERLKAATHAPVVSTAGAMVDVIRREGLRKVTIVSPYVRVVNGCLKNYFAAYDIEVDNLASFECATTEHLGRITQENVFDLAMRTVKHDAQALFIACSQLPTYDILPRLRDELKIPVWSSIAATASIAEQTSGSP